MFYITPKSIVRKTAFCNKTMDMRVPFKGTTKGMKDTDKTWDKMFGFVDFVKHLHNNDTNSLKKAVEKGTVFQKERTKFFVNGKNAVSVSALNELEGHGSRALLAILDATGRTKAAFASKRDKFHVTAVRAGIHGTAKRRVTAVNHLGDVFHFDISRVKGIFNDFIIVFKNVL